MHVDYPVTLDVFGKAGCHSSCCQATWSVLHLAFWYGNITK